MMTGIDYRFSSITTSKEYSMGVKSNLTLQEAQRLFSKYSLETLTPTINGVVDTTYSTKNYILKKYERSIEQQIQEDSMRLEKLHTLGFNVPKLLSYSKTWYLYTKLKGVSPKAISYYHIQALARFMARLHQQTLPSQVKFIESYEIEKRLTALKRNSFFYYKKLLPLKDFQEQCDGFIHGDIFKDNTLFEKEKIAVFDFIDGGLGSFAFDIAVALLSFNPKNKSSLNRLFITTYNHNTLKKISLETLKRHHKIASYFYALLRINNKQSITQVKELL